MNSRPLDNADLKGFFYMSVQWSPWTPFETASTHDSHCVYRIRLTDGHLPIELNRLLGSDGNGILAIGKTANFKERRKQFLRALKGKFGHSEGNLLHFITEYTIFEQLFPGAVFEYSIAINMLGEDVAEYKELLIKVYVRRFGEVPPLNSAIPKRYDTQGRESAAREEILSAI